MVNKAAGQERWREKLKYVCITNEAGYIIE